MTTSLINPHGGELYNLFVSEERKKELKSLLMNYESWSLTDRQICDLELILNGGFSPMKGFLNKKDYDSVLKNMRLTDETLWPMPITLDITKEISDKL
ncbi:MAG: adenylyltransferase, partial [Candidatus Marinimicrobia bacterium]|nr:adenylyltransferase [Candidatus Neomarinimicrobiota bacterium]